jgi:hypothetical protein
VAPRTSLDFDHASAVTARDAAGELGVQGSVGGVEQQPAAFAAEGRQGAQPPLGHCSGRSLLGQVIARAAREASGSYAYMLFDARLRAERYGRHTPYVSEGASPIGAIPPLPSADRPLRPHGGGDAR